MKMYVALLLLFVTSWASGQNGSVLSDRKISDTTANFTGVLGSGVNFGHGVAAIGDLNGNGITELVVGAYDVGGKGAIYTVFMNAVGGVDSFKTITENVGGFTGTLGTGNRFGYSVALIGDLDGDGIPDVAATSELDDDGGSDRGAVWILYLKADGTVKSHAKISSTTQGSLLATPAYGLGNGDRFGSEVAGIGDLDGDGVPDLAATAVFDDDGGSNRGAVWIIFLNANGSIKAFQKISDTQGSFTGTMQDGGFWGSGVASLGDLDGDGVQDLAVGQELANTNGTYKGALWILFMNTNGTVKSFRELRNGLTGTGLPTIADNSYFGSACAGIGDIDGDGIPDLAVGAMGSDSQRGAVYILMLNTNGTVKASQKINYNTGGLTKPLDINDLFGNSVVSIGDINGDGKTDIAVGAAFDDDGGGDKGAVYIITLQGVPTNCVNAAFNSTGNSVCQGQTITFTNSSNGIGNVTYSWKLNGTAVSTATNWQNTFNTTGTYTVRLIAVNDAPYCIDSVEVTVTVKAHTTSAYGTTICQGDSIRLGGVWRFAAGTYADTTTNANGCDSIATVTLSVLPNRASSRNISICQGQTYFAGGANRTVAGTYRDTLAAANGCDSVLTTILTIKPNATSTVNQTICFGDSYLGYNTTGVHRDTFVASNGCDSVRTLNLTVRPQNTSNISQSICQGQSFEGYTATGVYRDTLTAANGCDSVRTLNLTVGGLVQNTINQTVCFGDSYLGYAATGTYRDTFATPGGCDSVRTLNLTVRTQSTSNISQSICQGQSFEGYTATGVYRDTLTAANGCDSVRTLNLTVGGLVQNTINQTVCFGDSYLGYAATGTYRDTFATPGGCDSVRTLNLTVRPQNTSNINRSICQGQSFEGYTATGVYRDTLTAANGCDSVRTLNLTVGGLVQNTINQTVCFGDSYLGYAATGTYRDTFATPGGCDSVRTLNLTVRPQNTSTISQSICQGQSFEGYTATGVYRDTLTAANGCDSIRTLNLTVGNLISSTETVSICQGDSYLGYTQSGTYTDTLTATGGCDSVHTLTLTVVNYPIAPAITSANNLLSIPDTFAAYQWYLDGNLLVGQEADTLAAAANGNYTVVVANTTGCADTSAIFNLTGIGINDVAASWQLAIYPNPTMGNITLAINVQVQWGLLNNLGQVLLQGQTEGATVINLSNYADGVYYLQLQSAGNTITRKVVLLR